jgi:hypothetical protein
MQVGTLSAGVRATKKPPDGRLFRSLPTVAAEIRKPKL